MIDGRIPEFYAKRHEICDWDAHHLFQHQLHVLLKSRVCKKNVFWPRWSFCSRDWQCWQNQASNIFRKFSKHICITRRGNILRREMIKQCCRILSRSWDGGKKAEYYYSTLQALCKWICLAPTQGRKISIIFPIFQRLKSPWLLGWYNVNMYVFPFFVVHWSLSFSSSFGHLPTFWYFRNFKDQISIKLSHDKNDLI